MGDEPKVRLGGFAEKGRDQLELLDVVLARAKRLAIEHLCEDAPDAPDVDGRVVVPDGEHELRRAVPPGNHIPEDTGQGRATY